MTKALAAKDVRHSYGKDAKRLLALDGVSLAVNRGEFVAIVGPSGCGKSTLLRVMGGLLTPTEGTVVVDGQPLREPQRKIGIVFQNVNLMPWRTVQRNVMLPLEVARVSRRQASARATQTLELVGLQDFADSLPRELSGGMAQRVAIARALVSGPEVMLLDEPFGALDALSREQMNLELLRIWRVERVTAILVTHNLQEAIFLADRVLVMTPRPGRIQAEVVVDLPRPRTLEVMYTEFFGALSRRVRDAISSSNSGLARNEGGS